MLLSDNELYAVLGKRVQTAREQAQMTQEELAARIGFSRASISNIERGRQKIQVHTLWSIATALGVSIQQLLPVDGLPVEEPDRASSLGLESLEAPERDWVRRVLVGGA